MPSEEFRLADSVLYDVTNKEVVVALREGSHHAWQIRLLKMVKREPSEWVPLTNITEQQLKNVTVYGDGQYILCDDIDQVFRVTDLLAGIYSREAWLQSLMATTR